MAGASTLVRKLLHVATAGAVVLVLVVSLPVAAGVTTSDSHRAHKVSGTTAKALVSNMQRHPINGDHGGAFANIRPRYTLSIDSEMRGAQCRATGVDVAIRFTITLPEATQRARMSRAVRSAWDGFVSFAKRHENTHRSSYVGCAKSFIAAATRERAASCSAVESAIRRKFEQMKRDCEARQVSFDRSQRGAVLRLRLFNMAGF